MSTFPGVAVVSPEPVNTKIRSLGVLAWIPAPDESGQEAEFELSMAKERQKKVRFCCRGFRV